MTSLTRNRHVSHSPSPEGRTENSPGPKAFGPWNHPHNGIALKAPPARYRAVFSIGIPEGLPHEGVRTGDSPRTQRYVVITFNGPVSFAPNCACGFFVPEEIREFLKCHRVALMKITFWG
jgi:hypothetical protein